MLKLIEGRVCVFETDDGTRNPLVRVIDAHPTTDRYRVRLLEPCELGAPDHEFDAASLNLTPTLIEP